MVEPVVSGENVAQLFANRRDAEHAVTDLRRNGFADVRISERSGYTSQAHVPPEAGATQADFVATLARAGYDDRAAAAFGAGVAAGKILVTIASGARTADAVAVLRGETIAARVLPPVDATATPVAASTADVAVAPATAPVAADDERVVLLRAEALDVSTAAETTEARVRREVVVEQRTVVVPVRHEELVIERDGADPVRVPLSPEDPAS